MCSLAVLCNGLPLDVDIVQKVTEKIIYLKDGSHAIVRFRTNVPLLGTTVEVETGGSTCTHVTGKALYIKEGSHALVSFRTNVPFLGTTVEVQTPGSTCTHVTEKALYMKEGSHALVSFRTNVPFLGTTVAMQTRGPTCMHVTSHITIIRTLTRTHPPLHSLLHVEEIWTVGPQVLT